jgi:cyclophilin family peptidyl-prolyl cis-trans isomerase
MFSFLISGCVYKQTGREVNNETKQNNMAEEKTAEIKKDTSLTINSGGKEIVLKDLASQYSGAILKTNFGDIKIKLYGEDSPLTVNNFLNLAQDGFYDKTKFHRVIPDFMIQGGDPNSKDDDWSNDGTGGPGYTVPAEIKLKNKRGTIATARLADQVNPEKRSSGSQFFINTAENNFLDGNYTVFGEVIEGMEIVDKIEAVETNENDHPVKDVIIESVELVK